MRSVGLVQGLRGKNRVEEVGNVSVSALVAVTEEVENRQINLQLIQLKQTN